MVCKQCGKTYAWENGVSKMVNGKEEEFCSDACAFDYADEHEGEEAAC